MTAFSRALFLLHALFCDETVVPTGALAAARAPRIGRRSETGRTPDVRRECMPLRERWKADLRTIDSMKEEDGLDPTVRERFRDGVVECIANERARATTKARIIATTVASLSAFSYHRCLIPGVLLLVFQHVCSIDGLGGGLSRRVPWDTRSCTCGLSVFSTEERARWKEAAGEPGR